MSAIQRKASNMKPAIRPLLIVVSVLGCFGLQAADWQAGMKGGKPEFKSMSQLAFGPEGILFVADTRAAAIIAVVTGDTQPAAVKPFKVEGLNQKIAGLLGTSADQILIEDLVVNPISHNAYLAVSRGRGPEAVPVLFRVKGGGELEAVSLDHVKYSRIELPNAPADGVVGEGRRQNNPRMESITDITFFEDRLLIAGLSNEEFASTLRAVPFPFQTVSSTSVEIYHGAHGRFETRAPVRTFVSYNVGNQPSLLAAYTCTPLVQFPLSDLKAGARIKGKTVAELGNGNRPLDMIVYQKDGKDYLLLANSSRGIMKISTENMASAESIQSPVGGGGTKGQAYESIKSWTGVNQLDKLDAQYALVVRRADGDALNLEALPLP
jgi:hypothetical protein